MIQPNDSASPPDGGLLFPAVAFVIWLIVAAAVGLTLLRLAWKVFRYAWS